MREGGFFHTLPIFPELIALENAFLEKNGGDDPRPPSSSVQIEGEDQWPWGSWGCVSMGVHEKGVESLKAEATFHSPWTLEHSRYSEKVFRITRQTQNRKGGREGREAMDTSGRPELGSDQPTLALDLEHAVFSLQPHQHQGREK